MSKKPKAFRDDIAAKLNSERGGIINNLRYKLPILEKKDIEDVINALETERHSNEAVTSANVLKETLDFYKKSKRLPQNIIFFKKLSDAIENVETENKVINEFKEKLDVLINGNKEIDELRRRPLFN